MHWRDAIKLSPHGTAYRQVETDKDKQVKRETYVRYKDGSCYRLVSINNKVSFTLSGDVPEHTVNGYRDWKPSETKM